MALITLTEPTALKDSLRGVNVEPAVFYTWDMKALQPAALSADIIETPVIDLNAVNPYCNRLVVHKKMTVAAADSVRLFVSPDGINWYLAGLYNGGTTGGTAIAAPALNEVALVALPSMRYVKAQITLAAAISTQTVAGLVLSLMRL